MTVRILAVCGNGQGSSMIMKMKVDQFLTQSNIDHTVNSCAVGEYKSELSGADIIIASTHGNKTLCCRKCRYESKEIIYLRFDIYSGNMFSKER